MAQPCRWCVVVGERQAGPRPGEGRIVQSNAEVIEYERHHRRHPGALTLVCGECLFHSIPPGAERFGPAVFHAGLEVLDTLAVAPVLEDVDSLSSRHAVRLSSPRQLRERFFPKADAAVLLDAEGPPTDAAGPQQRDQCATPHPARRAWARRAQQLSRYA